VAILAVLTRVAGAVKGLRSLQRITESAPSQVSGSKTYRGLSGLMNPDSRLPSLGSSCSGHTRGSMPDRPYDRDSAGGITRRVKVPLGRDGTVETAVIPWS